MLVRLTVPFFVPIFRDGQCTESQKKWYKQMKMHLRVYLIDFSVEIFCKSSKYFKTFFLGWNL